MPALDQLQLATPPDNAAIRREFSEKADKITRKLLDRLDREVPNIKPAQLPLACAIMLDKREQLTTAKAQPRPSQTIVINGLTRADALKFLSSGIQAPPAAQDSPQSPPAQPASPQLAPTRPRKRAAPIAIVPQNTGRGFKTSSGKPQPAISSPAPTELLAAMAKLDQEELDIVNSTPATGYSSQLAGGLPEALGSGELASDGGLPPSEQMGNTQRESVSQADTSPSQAAQAAQPMPAMREVVQERDSSDELAEAMLAGDREAIEAAMVSGLSRGAGWQLIGRSWERVPVMLEEAGKWGMVGGGAGEAGEVIPSGMVGIKEAGGELAVPGQPAIPQKHQSASIDVFQVSPRQPPEPAPASATVLATAAPASQPVTQHPTDSTLTQ